MYIASSIGILNQSLLKNSELNCTESELSKRETRNGLLGADIATDQTKTFNTEVSPRKIFRSNYRMTGHTQMTRRPLKSTKETLLKIK
jgi:hypothetical protein